MTYEQALKVLGKAVQKDGSLDSIKCDVESYGWGIYEWNPEEYILIDGLFEPEVLIAVGVYVMHTKKNYITGDDK